MKYSKKALITLAVFFILIFIAVTYELPYYIYKPGSADELEEMIEVEGAYPAEGHLHLLTVSGSQATPLEYVAAKMLPYHEMVPLEEARPEGISDEDYMQYQLHLMDNSQQSSVYVAYEAAGKEVTLKNDGVYVVQVVEGMTADGIIEPGDKILQADGRDIEETEELVEYVQSKHQGDNIQFEIDRNGEKLEKEIKVAPLPDDKKKVGIGVNLVKNELVDVDPPVKIASGNIGGPSAGLMFSLEMYNQLTEEDITKGYNIAGTGAIDIDGNVQRIGGIDKKVVAADKEGAEIMFAPNEQGAKGSNYEEAVETAKAITTDMKIVPVDTFQDALDYLTALNIHQG